MPSPLEALARQVVTCRRCPRLVVYREEVARVKRRAFLDWQYWGRPLPGFGSPSARLLVVGLAPAAHGGNRTGRMFTGDRSGDWLYDTMHRFGFANQGASLTRDDGLDLCDAYVTAAARCAPPDNKPTREELQNCSAYLHEEMRLLPARVVITLGKIAFDAYLGARRELGLSLPDVLAKFVHGGEWQLGETTLLASYHPSQRNTQTGFLTHAMFDAVFARARKILDAIIV
ncbi:MAG TPA: uracil-DNA glycosylase [Terriglobales bacterium]|nr:uracil-DNA glycosylase [Terriglobales bacterium]